MCMVMVWPPLRASARDHDLDLPLDRPRAAGDGLIAPTITKRLIEQFARTAPPAMPPPELTTLTPREVEVLTLIARGLTNAEIAAELVLSEATVKTHVKRVLAKLGARDRVQAVVLAYEAGLVTPGDGAATRRS